MDRIITGTYNKYTAPMLLYNIFQHSLPTSFTLPYFIIQQNKLKENTKGKNKAIPGKQTIQMDGNKNWEKMGAPGSDDMSKNQRNYGKINRDISRNERGRKNQSGQYYQVNQKVHGSEGGEGRRQMSQPSEDKNLILYAKPVGNQHGSFLKVQKGSKFQNNSLMLRSTFSKRMWNTVMVDQVDSEDSGNVTSESELDMNASVPEQVQQEIAKKNDVKDQRKKSKSFLDFFKIGRTQAKSQDGDNKQLNLKEFYNSFTQPQQIDIQNLNMNESYLLYNRIAQKQDHRHDIRSSMKVKSKQVANSIYLMKHAKTQKNSPEKKDDTKQKKKQKSAKKKIAKVGNYKPYEKQNSIEAQQNSDSVNNDKMSAMPPNSNSNGIKSQKVGSEIHKSKFSEEQKSYCASIQEKPAALESSLMQDAAGFNNKEKRKDFQAMARSPRMANMDDCDEERNKDDDLQIQSIQRSIVSETLKKPINFVGGIKSGDMSGCSNPNTQALDTNLSQVPKTDSEYQPKQRNISLLEYHMKCYESNKQRIDQKVNNPQSFQWAKERLKKKIDCIKFNYSLDGIVQNISNYEGYIKLSDDNQNLEIFLKKPKEYRVAVAQDDDCDSCEDGEEFLMNHADDALNDIKNDVNIQTETDKKNATGKNYLDKKIKINIQEGVHYEFKKSSCSTPLKNIVGLIYGGLSTRFWLYRKHMNYMSFSSVKNGQAAFYAWQCITLQLENREIDLVIPDDQEMDCLIEVLIEAMNTVDGNKNSAEIIYQAIEKEKYKQLYHYRKNLQQNQEFQGIKLTNKEDIVKRAEITDNEIYQVLRTTCIKYKIMKIRSKISFCAFQKGNTIYELILMQIARSFSEIAERKMKELDDNRDCLQINLINDDKFQKIIDSSFGNIFKNIMALNAHQVKNDCADTYKKIKYQEAVQNLQSGKDFVEVKDKFGIIKVKEIDKQANLEKAGNLYSMLTKVRASDMFLMMNKQGNQDEDQAMAGDKYQQLLRYNQKKERLQQQYNKLLIIVNMRAVQSFLFVRICLVKIRIAKLMLIHELEQGKEVYIPNELSQDSLPMAFWFYDSLLNIVEGQLSHDNKRLIEFKNEFRLNFYYYDTLKNRVLRKLKLQKVVSTQLTNISFRQQMVSKNELLEMDHHKSYHVKALQRSRYLVIDNRYENLEQQDRIQQINLMDDITRSEELNNNGPSFSRVTKEFRSSTRKIMVRYCHAEEINVLRQRDLVQKQTFLGKIKHLKIKGLNLELLEKTHSYIEHNIDELYKLFKKKDPEPKTEKTLREIIFAEQFEQERVAKGKTKLIDFLMNKVEEKQKKKQIHRRFSSINDVRNKCSDKLGYQERAQYVETAIEKDIVYFSGKKKSFQDIIQLEIQKQKENKKDKQKKLQQLALPKFEEEEILPTRQQIVIEQQSQEQSHVRTNTNEDNASPMSNNPEQLEAQPQMSKFARKLIKGYDEKYKDHIAGFTQKANNVDTDELDQLQTAINESENLLRQRIFKLDEDRAMLKKLIAMQMENNQGEQNKEELNDMIAESQESQKDEEENTDGRPRVIMKNFQNVLLKTYKNDENRKRTVLPEQTNSMMQNTR